MSPHRHAEHQSKLKFLLQSAAALASTTVVTAGLGFVYWAVAARAFPAIAVGESSTAITAVSLIAPLTVLGFGTLLLAELPTMKQGRSTLLSTAALLTGVVASAVALGCAFGLPSDFLGLPEIGSRPAVALIFAATLFITTISSGPEFHGAIGSLVSRFFTNSIQPKRPVLRKSPILGCSSASPATLFSTYLPMRAALFTRSSSL